MAWRVQKYVMKLSETNTIVVFSQVGLQMHANIYKFEGHESGNEKLSTATKSYQNYVLTLIAAGGGRELIGNGARAHQDFYITCTRFLFTLSDHPPLSPSIPNILFLSFSVYMSMSFTMLSRIS